ncbi:hypothetical protein TNCV_1267901 [Trichonephila clavipes]|nr:hypothetical protein TNCV_1267901 [Trichonephila clavipes]
MGCRIALLEFPKSVRMHNGHEWVQMIRHDAYVPVTVISTPVHVHQLGSTVYETRQIRQRVSSHQQSNVGVDGPMRGVKLCVVQ